MRHGLPNERVVALVTQSTRSFLRADAVEVRVSSPDRVEPPCPHAGPGRCGGCDFQHVDLAAQRRLKATLVAEQLRRVAGVTTDVVVEALPGPADGLGWRTRVGFALTPEGGIGLRRHRSHDIEPIERCRLAAPAIDALGLGGRRFPGLSSFEVVCSPTSGECLVDLGRAALERDALSGLDAGVVSGGRVLRPPGALHVLVHDRPFRVSAGAFWQVHPSAAATLVDAVLPALGPRRGETCLDLYSGVGLFSVFLAAAVGRSGRVVAVERDRHACTDAVVNVAAAANVEVRRASVTPAVLASLPAADLVVLDPARDGVGVAAMRALVTREPAPRALAYVSCDPATYARDLAVALAAGWSLASLRAFDLFPMTEHVELVSVLVPPGEGQPARR